MKVYLGKNKYPTIEDSYEKWIFFFQENPTALLMNKYGDYAVYLNKIQIGIVKKGVVSTITGNYGSWHYVSVNGKSYYELPRSFQR